jgi:Zn-finger nucleic acid-binding protein
MRRKVVWLFSIFAWDQFTRYNETMICPNDHAEMHQVKIIANYGQPLFLDQCEVCGGIWFDESELYRAKQGEAGKIDSLDEAILILNSAVENHDHNCPKDGAILSRFNDKNFPANLIVERCPVCDGFWLNRGIFKAYQLARQELLKPKEPNPGDKKLQAEVEKILADHRNQGSDDVLHRLGKFLITPVDTKTLLPLGSNDDSLEPANSLGVVLNVLTTLLRLFVFR